MKIELTKDEIQTIANTLFEFVESCGADITRENELEKIRALYKKFYNTLNQKNNELKMKNMKNEVLNEIQVIENKIDNYQKSIIEDKKKFDELISKIDVQKHQNIFEVLYMLDEKKQLKKARDLRHIKEDMKEFKEAFEKETDEREIDEMIEHFEDIKETVEELLNNATEELSCINYVIEELLKKDFTVDEADLEFEDCKFTMIDAEYFEDEYFERYMLYRKMTRVFYKNIV